MLILEYGDAFPVAFWDAPDAHAVLVGRHDLILELLVITLAFRLQDKRASTLQALGSLVPVLGVAVLANALAASNAGKHGRWSSKASPNLALDLPASNGQLITTESVSARWMAELRSKVSEAQELGLLAATAEPELNRDGIDFIGGSAGGSVWCKQEHGHRAGLPQTQVAAYAHDA